MKKANVTTEVAQAMNESTKVKGAKQGKAVTSMSNAPTKKEVKQDFISFIVSNEEISVSKFFKLFAEFKVKHPQRYANYCTANNLNLNTEYSFTWFAEHCPKDANGNFAKWVKVSEKVAKNENEAYNRTTEKGVTYTLVPFNTNKASYEQFLPLFQFVVADVKRIEREKARKEREAEKAKEKARKEKEQAKKLKEKANELFADIMEVSSKYSVPFETAVNIYASIKKINLSKELKDILQGLKEANTKKK